MTFIQFVLASLLFMLYMEPIESQPLKYRDLNDPEYAKFVSKAALDNIEVTPNNTQLQELLMGINSSLLTEYLSSSSPEKRQLGVLVLGASSPQRANYGDLIKFFSDPSDIVKAQAARGAQFLGLGDRMDMFNNAYLEELTLALVDLWKDPSPKVQKEAMLSFVRFGGLQQRVNYSRQYKRLLKIGSSTKTEMEIREAIIDAFKEIRKWERPHPSLTPRFIRKIDKSIQKFDSQKAKVTNIKGNCFKAVLSKFLGR